MKTPDLSEEKPSAVDKRDYSPHNDLFPESLPPVLAAYWPKPGTRADDALQVLLTGPQNQADFWQSWRLAASIKELEYAGWVFVRRDILKPGCRRVITEYSLDRTDPSTVAALASRQRGSIDATLAGLVAFAGVCAALLLMVPR